MSCYNRSLENRKPDISLFHENSRSSCDSVLPHHVFLISPPDECVSSCLAAAPSLRLCLSSDLLTSCFSLSQRRRSEYKRAKSGSVSSDHRSHPSRSASASSAFICVSERWRPLRRARCRQRPWTGDHQYFCLSVVTDVSSSCISADSDSVFHVEWMCVSVLQ